MESTELISEIERAFNGVARPAQSLRDNFMTTKYGLSGKFPDDAFGHNRVDSKWQDIPDSEIEEYKCVMCHMGPEELRYYLPAFMRYAVKYARDPNGEDELLSGVLFHLSPSGILYDRMIHEDGTFNTGQKGIIMQFLHFVSTQADPLSWEDWKEANKLLERFKKLSVGA